MRRFLYPLLCVLPAAALLLVSLSGCGGDEEKFKRSKRSSDEDDKPPVELKADKYGTITGKVTLAEGFNPPQADDQPMGTHTGSCHADYPRPEDKLNVSDKDWRTKPQWIVGADRGVKNVAVYLQPPDGKYFYLPPEVLKPANVLLEQPHCTFVPRVMVLFPSYYDGKTGTQIGTGQTLTIRSSPTVNHNYSINGAGVKVNNTLSAGAKDAIVTPRAELQPQLMQIRCDIHAWMQAYAFVLDHPYAAVTNDKGEFKIERVPLGVKLQVVAWHESAINRGYFLKGRDEGDTMELSANQQLSLAVKGQ